jgi:4-amino-4-deoxy-L-arabinose transferase-like glycosyltransferase
MTHEGLVLGGFLALAVLFRLPYFFRDVIDWDESVFILMGQSIADGNLPYTEVWDNKPPGGFALFAIIQYLFPHSLLAIRLFGAALVSLTAFLTYRLAVTVMPREAALLAGTLSCFAVSLLGSSGQSVMMEHVANPFILLALLLAIGAKGRARDMLLFGALLAASILIRTNLAYAAVIGGAAFALSYLPDGPLAAARAAVLGALGGLLVLFASTLPFLLAGALDLYATSVIRVPLAYSAFGLGISETVQALLSTIAPKNPAQMLETATLSKLVFWCLGALGLLLLAVGLRLQYNNRPPWGILLGALAITIATVANRQPFGHYLIQLMPFFAIGATYALWRIGLGTGWRSLPSFSLVLIAAMSMLIPPYLALHERYRSGETLYIGQNFSLAEYLRPRLGEDESIFVSRHILLYWLLDRTPSVPIAAFPNNIFLEEQIVKPLLGQDYSSERLLNEILDRRPTFLVLDGNDKNYAAVASFADRVDIEYDEVGRARRVFILRRADR